MSNIKAVLLIIVVIFLVGLAGGEAYYLFFYQPKPTSPTHKSPTISEQEDKISTIELLETRRKDLKNSALTSSTLVNQFEGKIIEINTKGGAAKVLNNFRYEVKLTLKGTGDDPTPFFLDKFDLSTNNIIERTREGEKPIEFSDFKIGDRVIIKRVLDMINGQRIETKIIKISS